MGLANTLRNKPYIGFKYVKNLLVVEGKLDALKEFQLVLYFVEVGCLLRVHIKF